MLCAKLITGLLLAGAVCAAAQTLEELKARWKLHDYSNLVLPLIDQRLGSYRSQDFQRAYGPSEVQELDYMIATTLCAVPEHKDSGCEYSKLLKLYGTDLWFEGQKISSASVSKVCCQLPPPAGTGGAGIDIRMKPKIEKWDQLLAETRSTVLDPVLGFRVEGAQAEDDISGFQLVETASDELGWSCKLEVSYVYSSLHGEIGVRLDPLFAGKLIDSGTDYWSNPAVFENRTGSAVRGMRRIELHIYSKAANEIADELQISLWENRRPFFSRKFQFSNRPPLQ